jgi:hypothetical protein
MRCSKGIRAKIINSIKPGNIGREVVVTEYIGKFSENENFQYRGVPCRATVNDHYWWVSGDLVDGLTRAYICDTWLEPIQPKEISLRSKKTVDNLV